MSTQTTVRAKVFLAIVALAGAGLLAAGPVSRDAGGTVELTPHPGLPSSRDLDTASAPRECDLKAGIDTACSFM